MEYAEDYLRGIKPVTVPDADHVALAHRYLDRDSDLLSPDPDFPWMRAGGTEHCPDCGSTMSSTALLSCLPESCRWKERTNDRVIRRATMNRRRVCEHVDFDDEDVRLMERAARACLENRRQIPEWLGRFLYIDGCGKPIVDTVCGSGHDAEREDLAGLTKDPALMAADVP